MCSDASVKSQSRQRKGHEVHSVNKCELYVKLIHVNSDLRNFDLWTGHCSAANCLMPNPQNDSNAKK